MPVFTANIPEALRIGDRIEIGGKIKDYAKKMSVNLCTQQGEEPKDVVLHFDVRFHRDNIISLSRKNGIWIGSGNYDTNYNMFVPGTMFRITFEIKDIDVITIYCQGKFHSNFLPKIPLCMANYVVAWGDMERVTHCYFYLGVKKGCEAVSTKPSPWPIITTTAAAITDDVKCCRKNDKITVNDEGCADKMLYDVLMYPDRRKYDTGVWKHNEGKTKHDFTQGFSNITDLSDCSEEISKTIEYSNEDLTDLKKRRKSIFPFSNIVSFMNRARKL